MYQSVSAFLAYFDAVNRRAMRDVAALPEAADGWAPSVGSGEKSWSINKLIGHIAGTRLFSASAYVGTGWINPRAWDVSSRQTWLPTLAESAAELQATLEGTPHEWLERKVETIGGQGAMSGWRLLANMVEHDIHHRSQIDAYAGLNGWDVPQIFNARAELVSPLQAGERLKHGRPGPVHEL